VVYVQAEADVLGIEGLGTIHVRDGNQDQLKLVVHGGLLRLVGPGHFRLTAAPPVTSRDITPGHRKLIGPPMSCFKGVRELRSQPNPTVAAGSSRFFVATSSSEASSPGSKGLLTSSSRMTTAATVVLGEPH
jgi:hypothetical protein